MTQTKSQSRGLSYWNDHSKDYPFHAQEDRNGNRVPFSTVYKKGKPQRLVAEHDEYVRRYGDFLRCPAPEIGATFWGFLTEEALLAFLKDWGIPDMRGRGVGQ